MQVNNHLAWRAEPFRIRHPSLWNKVGSWGLHFNISFHAWVLDVHRGEIYCFAFKCFIFLEGRSNKLLPFPGLDTTAGLSGSPSTTPSPSPSLLSAWPWFWAPWTRVFFVLSGLIQDGKFFFEIGAVRYFSVSAALVFKVARSYEIDLKLSFSAWAF